MENKITSSTEATNFIVSFDHLPDEVVLKIFGLFSVEQLQTRLRLVNRRWKRFAEDDSHYRNLLLHEDVPAPLLPKYESCVKHLHVRKRRNIYSVFEFIGKCTNLESLKVEFCLNDEYNDNLIDSLKNCHNLNTVVMRFCQDVFDASKFVDVVASHPMRKIQLQNIDPDGRIEFWSLSNIADFRLKGVSFNYLSVGHFCRNNRDSLTWLELIPDNNDFATYLGESRAEDIGTLLGDIGNSAKERVDWIMQLVGACRNLRALSLGRVIARELDDNVLVRLRGLHLSTLVLDQANLSEAAFITLFSQPMAKNFTKIGLCDCLSATNSVLRTIAQHCRQLEKFTFEKCEGMQTSQDCDDVLTLAANCKKLKKLCLMGFDIGVARVLHLLPQYLPDLMLLRYKNESEPMQIPSFLPLFDSEMPNFDVSGRQCHAYLYVKCERKIDCHRLPDKDYNNLAASIFSTQSDYYWHISKVDDKYERTF